MKTMPIQKFGAACPNSDSEEMMVSARRPSLSPAQIPRMKPSTTAMVIAAIVGAVCGAFLLLAAYFLGVALVGAGAGVALVHVVWTQIQGEPHPAVVIVSAVLGALLATWLQRYVIILGTAFGGAWTMVVGAAALLGNPAALKAAAAGDIWVAYPMNPAPGQAWVVWAFLALGALGAFVQMYWTAGDGGRVVRRKAKKEE